MRKSAAILLGLAISVSVGAEVYSPDWTKKMGELEKTLKVLLPIVSSDEKFSSPKYAKEIENSAKKIAKLSHGMTPGKTQYPDPDLAIPMMSTLFSKYAEHAYTQFKGGHRAYARELMRNMTGYCIACHSRNQSGPSFNADTLAKPFIDSLKPLEKAQFFAAARQFDRASQEFESIISNDQIAKNQILDWERAVRYSLAIAVRVKKDPAMASRIVDRILASPLAPFFLKVDAARWKDSIAKWEKEPGKVAKTEEGLYAQALELFAEARKNQKYPADKGADIEFLRATAVLHDLLGTFPRGRHETEALFLTGMSYDALRDLEIWDLHEFYYEACIHRSPHTDLSSNCFKYYEQSVYLGYSGSGGVFIPQEVQEQLQKLENLAKPVALTKPN